MLVSVRRLNLLPRSTALVLKFGTKPLGKPSVSMATTLTLESFPAFAASGAFASLLQRTRSVHPS
jgi:hypothetical protein